MHVRIPRSLILVALLASLPMAAAAQSGRDTLRESRRSERPAAVKRDSVNQTARPDSVALIDSLRIRFIPGLGAFLPPDSTDPLSASRFLFMDEKSPDEFLWRIPGFFVRDLGSAGQPSQITAYGTDIRSIPVLLDGRPMNDPVTGAFTLSDIPLEYVDRVEVLTGADAIRSGMPGPPAALNFVTRSYNSLRPVTKIRFVQDPKETILTDLLFTQNILRGVNLHLGVLRQVSQGLFANSALDAWNLRGRIRYNVSDRINISATGMYFRSSLGLNGGVDEAQTLALPGGDPFDNVTAVVRTANAYQIQTRSDLTIAGIARLLADSASTTHAVAYTTSVEREYALGQTARDPSSGSVTFVRPDRLSVFVRSRMSGVRLEQRLSLSPLALSGIIEGETRSTDRTSLLIDYTETRIGTGITGTLDLEGVVLSGSARYDRLRGDGGTSYGAAVAIHASPGIRLDVDASRGVRFPTIQELYWQDSLLVRRGTIGMETSKTYRAGLTIDAEMWMTLRVDLLRRDVDHALLLVPDSTASGTAATGLRAVGLLRTEGVTASATIRSAPFAITATGAYLHMTADDARKTLVPEIVLGGELTYQKRFLNGALDAKAGTRIRFTDRYNSTSFVPSALLFPEDTKYLLGRATTLDAFLVVRIGNAHISLAFDNLLNANQLIVPFYPLPKRHVRLGVNWTFLD